MKFSNGYWLTAEGFTIYTPKQLYDFEYNGDQLKLYLPVRKIRHRGDTLNVMLLTLCLSTPLEGIIRMTATHFSGTSGKKAAFELTQSTYQPEFQRNNTHLKFISGSLSAQIPLSGPFEIKYYDNETLLTSSGAKGLAYIETHNRPRIKEELTIGVGEMIYGLGERFGPFVKNGQTVETRNCDGGTASEQAYKNVPFYLTNKNYGVFVNHTEPVSFEIATEKVHRVQFSVEGEMLDYFIISGTDPKRILNRYTQLTGRPALVPSWSFGLWLSTSFLTDYDEAIITETIAKMRRLDLPVNVFHFDCFWMREYHWCDFLWDKRMFPDPESMLRRLHEMELKICLWINPYIAQRSSLFKEAKDNNYLLKKENGDVWQTDRWQPGMAIVDFTNPDACKWYTSHLQRLLDIGVDCFKTDFGERIPEKGVIWHDGSQPEGMRNFYSYLYNQLVYELLLKNSREKAVLFARSATTGGQKYPVHWGGDCESTFDGMAQSLRGGLSLGLSGFGYFSHDIGGFEGTPKNEIYKRWIPFGLLSSHSRLHGSHSYRVPWIFDEEAIDVLRDFTKLKLSLAPYLYQLAVEAHQTGIPMLRAMFVEFPQDPTCDVLDRQYMLGPSLLVAPVMSADNSVQFYLPCGNWVEWFSGKTEVGGKWFKKTYSFRQLPLYVRENTILPTAIGKSRTDYNYLTDIVFKIFLPQEGKTECVVFIKDDQKSGIFSVTRAEDIISLESSGELIGWRAEITGIPVPKAQQNCTITAAENKIVVTPENNRCSVEV